MQEGSRRIRGPRSPWLSALIVLLVSACSRHDEGRPSRNGGAAGGLGGVAGTNGGAGSDAAADHVVPVDPDGAADGGLDLAGETGDQIAAPRFLVLGPADPAAFSSAPFSSQVIDGSEDGSMLLGIVSAFDATTDTGGREEVFRWSAAEGLVTFGAEDPLGSRIGTTDSCSGRSPGVCPDNRQVSRDGRNVFGLLLPKGGDAPSAGDDGISLFRWRAGAGYTVFGPPNLRGGQFDLVSADGSAAVGLFTVDPALSKYHVFRWTEAAGFASLTSLPGWSFPDEPSVPHEPFTMSRDGNVLLGLDFAWSESSGVTPIRPPVGAAGACGATVLSEDGQVAFGVCVVDPQDPAARPPLGYRWTRESGSTSIGACAVSQATADGSVAVGYFGDAFVRWTAGDGCVTTPPPTEAAAGGTHYVELLDDTLSRDGRVVLGHLKSKDETSVEGVRWTEGTGFVRLSFLPGHGISAVMSGTRDGAVQAGYSATAGRRERKAVIWDSSGVRDVASELLAAGVDVHGMELNQADFVWARDGEPIMVVGLGAVVDGGDARTRAWIAWLPRR